MTDQTNPACTDTKTTQTHEHSYNVSISPESRSLNMQFISQNYKALVRVHISTKRSVHRQTHTRTDKSNLIISSNSLHYIGEDINANKSEISVYYNVY